jgi:demethylmenaquinone methyltransferase / 2-methoxy-6-polyprenyl-1,4-benzoquinol methylase
MPNASGDNSNAAAFDPEADDVFGRISGRYDRLCDVFSMGMHRHWKARMAQRMAEEDAGAILDVASGTGDIPVRLLRRAPSSKASIIVSDVSRQMLAQAARKLGEHPRAQLKVLDAHALDLPDASADLYSISFGMKICDRTRVLAEARRVLKPGGMFCCLEAARIPLEPLHRAYLAYMRWCLPVIARLATSGDASAYDYLVRGVHDFPEQKAFAAEIEAAGFDNVTVENLTLGIVAIHRAVKPH